MDNTRKFPLLLSNFWLKVIALLTMTIDHIGFVLEGRNGLETLAATFRHIGRLALPLFCFMIVEGALHTRSFKKYALRLGIMASAISAGMIIFESIPALNQGYSVRDLGIIFVSPAEPKGEPGGGRAEHRAHPGHFFQRDEREYLPGERRAGRPGDRPAALPHRREGGLAQGNRPCP